MARTQFFSPKDPKTRIQGILTAKGGRAFGRARARLSRLYHAIFGRVPPVVSDADTVEYLARGEEDCREELEKTRDQRSANGL